jgi:predicted membrane protein DUF2142
MTEPITGGGLRVLARRFRWIHLAPLLAFLALSAWAFASPIGAAPDDDFHIVSVWCADGGSAECTPAPASDIRSISAQFRGITCYAQVAQRSAACQQQTWSSTGHYYSTRGNFVGEYPPLYYATMRVFAGDDIQSSALAMRLINAALFVAIATALAALLPGSRRRTLLWGWLVTLVPLGMFLIPSNNPSGWAITGVGTAFLALLGWFDTTGRKRWALAALFLVGVTMAAGARGDGAVYAVGATVVAALIALPLVRPWWRSLWLPAIGIAIAVVFFLTEGQTGVASGGFSSGVASGLPSSGQAPLTGLSLGAYNLLMLPFLWTGVWGTWALGWFDTGLPAVVPAAAILAFLGVAFAGLGLMSIRKALAVCGVLLVLIVLPLYVLTVSGDKVGEALQPRYLLPLIVLFALALLTVPPGREFRLGRLQTGVVLAALGVANLVALQVNIRRYVTGTGTQGIDLDKGAEWWWTGFPVGPTAVWLIGSLAFAGLLLVLWPQMTRVEAVTADAPVLAARGS